MLNQQTVEKLYTMRMRGMADAFVQQQEDPQTSQLSFEERFALLVDRQWNWRQNRALERRLKEARLQGAACVEDIDFRAARGLGTPPSAYFSHRPNRDWENLSGASLRTEGLSRRVDGLLRHGRAVVPGTGTGAGRRQLRQEAA